MESTTLTIALSKGRILEETLPLLERVGIVPVENVFETRKLMIQTHTPDVRIVLVRASDVATYVARGAADFGVAGLDLLLEQSDLHLYRMLDLQIAKCRLSVAAPVGYDYAGLVRRGARIRVATKYVNLAREHFAKKGVQVDVIKLYGSMELAPLAGMADVIVDLVSSGKTLRENDLQEIETIMPVSSYWVVSPSAYVLKREKIKQWLGRLAGVLEN